ncbi:hypothetical protein [Lysinibacillus xylanilyticus]|uniref:hypothetical protein n=1 Tax=Lysinibacillus xylanilyticus TaxID=582475 RepID=UPI003CFDB055
MGISNRGTKAKTITSCDNTFVTNIVLAETLQRAKRLIGRPQESAQPERKSTSRYVYKPHFYYYQIKKTYYCKVKT